MAASTSFVLSPITLSLLCLLLQTKPCRPFQTAARTRTFTASVARQCHPRHSRTAPSTASRTALHTSGDENDDGGTDGGTQLDTPPAPPSAGGDLKFFELDNAFEDNGADVVGTKFFGGSSQKEELYVAADEERAVELQRSSDARPGTAATEYRRFEDATAFGDAVARRTGEALQAAINRVLYDERGDDGGTAWREGSSLRWDTPFPQAKGGSAPLAELATAKDFYNRLDVAILSATTVESAGNGEHVVEARWDIGALWPNLWESRVLLTGTSRLTVREEEGGGDGLVLLRQLDRLDGTDANDVVGKLAAQLPPRFWDMYHIGFSPSCELDPRLRAPPRSAAAPGALAHANVARKKGLLAGYALSHLPPRLVTEPSLVDANGRAGRAAQGLPNHAFTTAIRTMKTRGMAKEVFVPVSPIEVTLSKRAAADGGGSLVRWSVPVPPELASRAVLPLPALEDDDAEEDGDDDDGRPANRKYFKEGADAAAWPAMQIEGDTPSTFNAPGRVKRPPPAPPSDTACRYVLRPARLVATLPYAGSPQDEAVTELRRRLYRQVVERDGFAPKRDPATGRPVFFFWMNDAKACFTRAGGLGMAVYEWRAKASRSNEVGIELEC